MIEKLKQQIKEFNKLEETAPTTELHNKIIDVTCSIASLIAELEEEQTKANKILKWR